MKVESKYNNFHTSKLIWKCRLHTGGHFVMALTYSPQVITVFSLYNLKTVGTPSSSHLQWLGYNGGNPALYSLRWRHSERDGVSNHRRLECLLNGLFRGLSKKTSKLRGTGPCEGNSPVTDAFPSQRASNAENVSIWWRHHASIKSGDKSDMTHYISLCIWIKHMGPYQQRLAKLKVKAWITKYFHVNRPHKHHGI